MTPNAPMTAPPAPMPPNGDTDRAAIAREVLEKPEHQERIDRAIASLAKAWPVLAKHASHIDGEFDLALTDVKRLVELVRDVCPAVAPTPPPIPLDTVVEVEGDPDAPYRRVAGAWSDRSGNRWSDADAATIAAPLTALHHARRETEELRAIAGAMRATLAMVRKQRDDAERERGEMEQTIRQLNEMVDTTHAQRDEARADVNRWINAAMAALMPDEFGLEFDPTNPEGWAMTRRAVFERVLNERDAARDTAWSHPDVQGHVREWRERAQRAECELNTAHVLVQTLQQQVTRVTEKKNRRIAQIAAQRDAARRELAAVQDQGLGATARTSREAPNSEESDCGSAVASPVPASAPCAHTHTSPNADTPHADVVSETAPLSGAGNTGDTGKPRRWWLVVDKDGDEITVRGSYAEAVHTTSVLGETCAFGPYTVVPVIEARVTRETVERVAAAIATTWAPPCDYDPSHHTQKARAALSALGLTVEE